jgi:hypothetical protein
VRKPDRTPAVQSVHNMSRVETGLQNVGNKTVCRNGSYEQPTESWVRWRHFSYMKFLGSLWQNSAKNLFYIGRYDLSEILFQRPGEFPTAVTRKALIGWSYLMDHRKAERIVFWNGIWNLGSFGQSEVGNWRSILPLCCPGAKFSSVIDRQNSVASKPFSGRRHMSNG